MTMRLYVDLYLFTTKEGGRLTGITQGYRPDFYWGKKSGNLEALYSAVLDLVDTNALDLGRSANAILTPRWPDGWTGLRPGNLLAMREGGRQVGSARIVRIAP